MSHHYDQDLRRTRERIGSVKTQLALNEAILEIPEVTVFDAKRILEQLSKRKDDFKHIEKPKDARAAFIAWAARQARLIARFRAILPELQLTEQVASLTLLRLPDYPGNEDGEAFESWVREAANREAYNLSSLAELVTTYRAAVRKGIRKVLKGCIGLGLDSRIGPIDGDARSTYLVDDGAWSMTVDEIESDVWMDVARDIGRVLGARNPGALLHEKAFWFARAWKKRRLYERAASDTRYHVGLSGLEMISTDDNGEERAEGVRACSFYDLHNSFDLEQPSEQRATVWTDMDLEQHLRRAGQFRADDAEIDDPLPAAA